MRKNRIIGAVDLGTSKVVVLVGELVGPGRVEIIGKGEAPSRGVSKGEIIDLKAASDSVHAAMLQAEMNAGVEEIKNAYLSLSGRHVGGFYSEGTVNVVSTDNIVSKDDLIRAIAEAKNKQIEEDRIYIHNIRNPIRLDDECVRDPVGMEGNRLAAGYWFVTGNRSKVSSNMGTVTSMSCAVDDVIVSSVASAVMVVSEREKRSGVIVMDIGSGTTDYVAYKDGYIICAGVIPVGGDHITNDLSLGLRISRKHAEKLKIGCAHALTENADPKDKVWSVGDQAIGDRRVPVKSIHKIVNARMDELFELVQKKVNDSCKVKELISGVVLTGGSSRISGAKELCERKMGIPARVGALPEWVGGEIDDPSYATVLGLFHYAITGEDRDESSGQKKPKGAMGFLGKLLNMGA